MTTYRTYVLHDGYDEDVHPKLPPRPKARRRRGGRHRTYQGSARFWRLSKGDLGLAVAAVAIVATAGVLWLGASSGFLDGFFEGDSASVSVDAPAELPGGAGSGAWTAAMTAELHRLVNLGAHRALWP